MSSSDDEPLVVKKANGSLSKPTIPKSTDNAMDKQNGKPLPAGVSIRNGPVTDAMDIDTQMNGKRKSRSSGKAVNYSEVPSDDDKPLIKRPRKSAAKRVVVSDDDSDVPLARKKSTGQLPPSIADTGDNVAELAKEKEHIEKLAEKEAKALRAKENKAKLAARIKDDSTDSDAPIIGIRAKKAAARKETAAKKAAAKKGVKKEESSDDDKPLVKKATPKAKAKPAPKVKAKKEESEEAEDAEEEYRWWEMQKEDDTIKWNTLEHNGVVFPPPYEPLPKNVKLVYDGTEVDLHKDAEEIASFFGGMLNSTNNVENPTFQKNFFRDFTEKVKETGGAKDAKTGKPIEIKEFAKLNFENIFQYLQAKSEARKARPAAEKKAEKAETDKALAKYMYCQWDGRKEKVGNFRVEPPGLFRGRGDHPKTGSVKKRVMPEQIIINIGKDAKVPEPPAGHKWKEVRHDNQATWLAMWQENINGNYKYVMLAATSAIKGQSDFKKFEKARELKNHIVRIRKDYGKDLKAELMADRQRATAVYLIDKFALRAGNEKDTDNEAETVGCCSLKYEHITLKPPNIVIFDFLGKDSIRYYDEVTVDPQVFKNLKIFKKHPKKDGDDIFDRLNTSQLNKHLSGYMAGLTAKVFRTYNASVTMSELLKELKFDKHMNMQEKIKLYNDCNRKVAILCNHKRTVGAGHAGAMEKLSDKIKAVKYQKWRLKHMLLDLDPSLKKKKGAAYFELDEDLTQEWVLEHQAFLIEEHRQKIQKKFEKENEKLAADGEKEMKASELEERLKSVDELKKKLDKENKSKKVIAEGKGITVEKLENQIEKIEGRIATMLIQAEDREGNKEVALGTSKINYIDPRLTVVFSNKFDIPLDKLFNKSLREKFNWAIQSVGDDTDWEF